MGATNYCYHSADVANCAALSRALAGLQLNIWPTIWKLAQRQWFGHCPTLTFELPHVGPSITIDCATI